MNDIKRDHESIERQKQGITSFTIIDSELVFRELNLKQGSNIIY